MTAEYQGVVSMHPAHATKHGFTLRGERIGGARHAECYWIDSVATWCGIDLATQRHRPYHARVADEWLAADPATITCAPCQAARPDPLGVLWVDIAQHLRAPVPAAPAVAYSALRR